MSQKKNEQNGKENVSTSSVSLLWDQFEGALQQSRELLENGFEASIKTIENTAKVNSEFRNGVKSFYVAAKKANEELINSFSPEESEIQKVIQNNPVTKQWKDVANLWENILITPTKSSLDIIERLEEKSIDNSIAYLDYLQNQSNESAAAIEGYFKLARKTHESLAKRVEDSVKLLVGTAVK